MDEAVARGQLPLEGGRFPKRRKLDHQDRPQHDRPNQRGRGRGRGRGQGRGDFTRAAPGRGAETARAPPAVVHPLPPKPPSQRDPCESEARNVEADPKVFGSGSDSDSDGAPEVVSSKPPAVLKGDISDVEMDATEAVPQDNIPAANTAVSEVVRKPRPKQPRRTPHNPFATRPALLRNVRCIYTDRWACAYSCPQLLLPEIKMTISNLSQAIRFLVDNDFLDNVELRPGQADEKMIEVIESTTDEPTVAPTSTIQII